MLSIDFSLRVTDFARSHDELPHITSRWRFEPGINFARYWMEKCIGHLWYLFPQRTVEKPVYRVASANHCGAITCYLHLQRTDIWGEDVPFSAARGCKVARNTGATTTWSEHREAALAAWRQGFN
jgi:hypothetical protein